MNRTVSLTLTCLALLAFAACGGGGSGPETYDGPLTVPHDGGSGNLGDGTGGGSGGGGPSLTWRELATGVQSTPTSLTTRVARNMTEYSDVYSLYYVPMPPGVGAPDVGPPPVDFETETVVAVFLGIRPTGGYSVRIADIVPEGDGVRVTVEETVPGPNCIVTQALTAPFVMVAVSRFEGSATFESTTVTNNCP